MKSEVVLHPNTRKLLARQQVEQRSDNWFEKRRKMVTASEVFNVLEQDKPKKKALRTRLIRNKVQAPNNQASNFMTNHGVKQEPKIIKLLEKALGVKIFDVGLVQHPEYPFVGAQPDGVTSRGQLVEIKAPVRRQVVPGLVLPEYLNQMYLQMITQGINECIFAQYMDPDIFWPAKGGLYIEVIELDRGWFEKALPKILAFKQDLTAVHAAAICTPIPKVLTLELELEEEPCLVVDGLYCCPSSHLHQLY